MKNYYQKLVVFVVFTIMSFIALQIPFSALMGPNTNFTLFDFIAPVAGAFVGPLLGVATVLGVEVIDLFVKQTPWTTGSIIHLFPTLFAVYYFGIFTKKRNKNTLILAVPLLAILAFLLHPIGRSVWYYSLFWLVPVLAYFKRKSVFVRSLGATFTAHAVGGAAWIWAFNLPAGVWQNLIPVVIKERLLFAMGTFAAYYTIRYMFNFLVAKKILPKLQTTSFMF